MKMKIEWEKNGEFYFCTVWKCPLRHEDASVRALTAGTGNCPVGSSAARRCCTWGTSSRAERGGTRDSAAWGSVWPGQCPSDPRPVPGWPLPSRRRTAATAPQTPCGLFRRRTPSGAGGSWRISAPTLGWFYAVKLNRKKKPGWISPDNGWSNNGASLQHTVQQRLSPNIHKSQRSTISFHEKFGTVRYVQLYKQNEFNWSKCIDFNYFISNFGGEFACRLVVYTRGVNSSVGGSVRMELELELELELEWPYIEPV